MTRPDRVDDIRLLIDALGGEIDSPPNDPRTVVATLIDETVRFRDKLKSDTGETLTVEDTRIALIALEQHLRQRTFPPGLTDEQRALAQIYVDRLTLFGG